MSGSSPLARPEPLPGAVGLQTLDAMAAMAHDTRLVVHVVVPRGPGVVEHARAAARRAGVECSADLRAHSVRLRFESSA